MIQLRAFLLVPRSYVEGLSALTWSTAVSSGAAIRVLTQQTLVKSEIHAYPTEWLLAILT